MAGPPRFAAARRVVVTGIGMVTPLGVGAPHCWSRLVAGDCGVRAIGPDWLRYTGQDDLAPYLPPLPPSLRVGSVHPCPSSTLISRWGRTPGNDRDAICRTAAEPNLVSPSPRLPVSPSSPPPSQTSGSVPCTFTCLVGEAVELTGLPTSLRRRRPEPASLNRSR